MTEPVTWTCQEVALMVILVGGLDVEDFESLDLRALIEKADAAVRQAAEGDGGMVVRVTGSS